jgi:N-dimethylarginine dimethylaminohydrolase
MEGGSFAWLTSKTAVVGRSNCVNEEATRQVEQVLQGQGVEVLRVDLAFTEIHLDGVFSMIAPSVALVDVDRVPYSFIEAVHDRGVETIPLGPDDDRWVINSLALRPGTIVMPEGLSDPTRQEIEARGIDIVTVPFGAIHENGGGIRCSTSPLARDPVPDTTAVGAGG